MFVLCFSELDALMMLFSVYHYCYKVTSYTNFGCACVYVGWWRGACATSVRQEVHSPTKHSEWLVEGGTGICVYVDFVWRKESCVECYK